MYERVLVPSLVVTLLVASPVLAADPAQQLEAAISTWDLTRATALLETLEGKITNDDLAEGRGWVSFLSGDYAGTVADLRDCTSESCRFLWDLAVARADIVKGLIQAPATGSRFKVWHTSGPDEAMVPYLVEAAEAAWDVLEQRLHVTPNIPISIEILPDEPSLAISAGLSPTDLSASGAVAVCKFNRIILLSPSSREFGYPYADTVSHELVHFFLITMGGDAFPVWFQEALAKFLEPAWRGVPPGTLHRSMTALLDDAISTGELIPFDRMRKSLAYLGGESETALAFAELSSFAQYIETTRGPSVWADMAHEMTRAGDDMAVFRATGTTLDSLVGEWLEGLAAHGPVGMEISGISKTSPLSPDMESSVKLARVLRRKGRPMEAAITLKGLLESVESPDPALAFRCAAAFNTAHAPKSAIDILDRLNLDEQEFPLLARERGRALLVLGRFDEARAELLTAVRSDPYDPVVHAALERVWTALGRPELAEREHRLAGIWR